MLRSRAVVSLSFVLGAVVVVACGSSSRKGFGDSTDAIDPGGGGGGVNGAGADGGFAGCATATEEAHLSPAAMLVALDKSGTMASGGKFSSAQTAIVQAIDDDAFDTMSLGILGFPGGQVAAPACLFGLVANVDCGVSALPNVPLAPAGTMKSATPGGVRNAIYTWLANASPQPGDGDGNPTYAALQSGIGALQAWPSSGKRILFYITDGGASCASVASPSRAGYTDGNGCPDWEEPSSIVDLLTKAHADAKAPVNTVVVGVPGADSHGENANVPPYSVRLALSAYAAAGSPETIDPSCTGTTFTQSNVDPTKSCHFDMTTSYSAKALADAISQIRGALLGCTFDLPPAPSGQTLDPGTVNVEVDVGGVATDLFQRATPGEACDECWDYTPDGRVELLGAACSSVKSSPDAKVKIVVGCATRIQ